MSQSELQMNQVESIEREINKFIDINTIFKKLKDQGSFTTIYQDLYKIFNEEHEFTINGFL